MVDRRGMWEFRAVVSRSLIFVALSIGLLPTLVKKLNGLHLHKKTLPVQSPTGRLFNLIYIGFTASITEE